tara:strand:+ start:455 stop:670 length:216 start_codon:yes stop_codon:yes gene_type:complete
MNTGLLMLLFTSDPALGQDCDDLKRDMIALELFLQDKKDHTEYCPKISWEQPTIDVYKKELKSQLPEGCKE